MQVNPDILIGQFLLSEAQAPQPKGWSAQRLGRWHLAFHARLPVVRLLDADSRPSGWLLGWAIGPEGDLIDADVRVPGPTGDAREAEAFESWLHRCGGRYLAILLRSGLSRVYLDPCGSLAAVYCPAQRVVASTPSVIPDADGCEWDEELLRTFAIPARSNWFPFGLTPRRGLERLIPNHYLDLARWEAVRHWPVGTVQTDMDLHAAAEELGAILRRQISAVTHRWQVHMSLTAGRDSRMLLACSREHLEQIAFFTCAPAAEAQDVQVAKKLARRFGLAHTSIAFRESSSQEHDEYLARTGWCLGGPAPLLERGGARLDGSRPFLSGQGGDVMRTCFWRPEDSESTPLSGEDLIQRMWWCLRVGTLDDLTARAQRWLEAAGEGNSLTVLDLLYVEQRLGCWAGPRAYAHVSCPFVLYPFCHRRAIEIMMGVPPAERRQKRLEEELIRRHWPELLRLPFNAPVGIKGFFHTVKDAIRRRCKRRASPTGGR
jgi:asparagine synthetase B (glutamine-hydrolysing)